MTIVIGDPVCERAPVVFIYVTCECGQEFETSEANAAKRTLCPICGRVLTLPRAPIPPEPTALDHAALHISDESVRAVTSRAAIASLVLGVLFFLGCLSGLPAILVGGRALRHIATSGGRIKGRGIAILGIVTGLVSCVITVAMMVLAHGEARASVRRVWCASNLKQLAMAMHNYQQYHGCLPPAAITDKDGKPLLSWRVAILPYLDASDLYDEFHLDEPWDSPHNAPLALRTPGRYGCPSNYEQVSGMTNYQVIVGTMTAFRPDYKPVRLDEFTDGVQHTILIAESRQAVPWSKPDDIPVFMMIPLTEIGMPHGRHGDGFNVVMADGAGRFIKNSVNPDSFRAAATRNGSEVISDTEF